MVEERDKAPTEDTAESAGITREEVLKRGGAAVLGVSAAASLLPAAAGAAPATRARRRTRVATPRDTLVVAVEGDVDTFDPAFTVGSKPSQTTIQNTFDQLTQYKQVTKRLGGVTYPGVDTEQILGMLAQSYTRKGNDYVFTLRRGLKYHDGTPITPKAIEDGYRRVFEAQGISYFLLQMAAVTDPDHIKALDSRRVRIHMDKPNLLLLKNNTMHNTSAVSPEEAKEHATAKDKWATDYFKKRLATGNGPFKLAEYVPGDRIELERSDGYYGGRPRLARVIQKIVPEASQRVLLLKRGEVDMIMVPPVKELDSLKEDPNLRVLSFPNPRNVFLEMNNKLPPFDKKAFRQAVSYAIPYDTLLKSVMHGYAQKNRSIIGAGMPSSDFSFWKYNTDLKKAADKLKEAGYPGGSGAPEITITVRADWEEAERAAILISANLKQLGLRAQIQKLAFAPFNEQEQGKKLQVWIDEWLSWVNDPWYHMSWIVASNSPTNYVSYKNSKVDALIKRWTLSLQKQGRIEGSRQAQKLIVEDAPLAFLYGANWNVVTRKNVRGYRYYNDELNRYAYMYKTA
jgi:peptide/nickel transport system substrate-binding protein